MPAIQKRVKLAMDESRMLILGAQVLLGFQFTAAFYQRFDQLPRLQQELNLVALVAIIVATLLLIWPSAYHQVVESGEDRQNVLDFSTAVMQWALLPFVMVMALDIFIPSTAFLSFGTSAIVSGSAAVIAISLWYGPRLLPRARQQRLELASKRAPETEQAQREPTPLSDRINQVLTEARVALPGAQALLGFQFAVMLERDFNHLPSSLQYLHLASLLMIALATMLLITPAAYHRVVEHGEESEHFFQVAHWLVLVALIPLALGICGDLLVVAEKVSGSRTIAAALSALMLVLFAGLWFGYTAWQRQRKLAGPGLASKAPTRSNHPSKVRNSA